MPINISNLQSNAPNLVNSTKSGTKIGSADSSSKKSDSNVNSNDPVSLTSDAKQLSAVQQTLLDTPVDNSDKIAALKQAVSEGSYKIDSAKLAQNISNFENQINKSLFG